MRPLHGIDFAAMGQRRFSHIKFIEIKGPVAEAVMRNNPNIKGRSQNFDPALFPQSPNEILGVADLFEIRNPAEKLASAASFEAVFKAAGDSNYLIINQ